MTTKEIRVESNNMLSVFSGVDIIHPYRFQPYLALTVPYSEYRKFVKLMVSLNCKCLAFSSDTYNKAMEQDNDELLRRYYLNDLSNAIYNELFLTHGEREATCIWHEFEDIETDTFEFGNVKEVLESIPEDVVKKAFAALVENQKLDVPITNLSVHNQTVLYYAWFLKCCVYYGTNYAKNITRE